MTWSGWAYNLFSWYEKQEKIKASSAIIDSLGVKPSLTNPADATLGKADLLRESRPVSGLSEGGSTGVAEDDKHLNDISNSVAELHSMSLMISEALETHGEILERIDTKTEIVHDKTLAATLKASQINQRARRSGSHFIGLYQFVDMVTNMYLCVDADEYLTYSADPTRGTFFNCYCKEGNIIGIQNAKTLTYVGSTWRSSVKASGRVFGKQEECHIGLRDGQLTGLFLLGINWGGGGWLKKPVTPADPSEPIYLTSVTASVTDKADAAIFRTVLISTKDVRDDEDDEGDNRR
jgi:hypothetical protein